MTAIKPFPSKSKAISIGFDSHTESIIVLCADGSIWRRVAFRNYENDGRVEYEWAKIDLFTGTE